MSKTRSAAPAQAVEKKADPIEKVEHKNLFAALAAFQSENPTIERTKEFGEEGGKGPHFFYSPLGEVLQTVRPLTSKHGLSFTWEEGNGGLVAALYHETYSYTKVGDRSTTTGATDSNQMKVVNEPIFREENVIRSMSVKVKRDGDMKDIGNNSTYARRYTLAEVLGIAPDEDDDIGEIKEQNKKLGSFAYNTAEKGIKTAKDVKTVEGQIEFFAKELKAIEDGKTPSLGLSEEDYRELTLVADERKAELKKKAVGTGKPGDNKDAGGDAEVQLGKGNQVPPIPGDQ